MLSSEDIRRLAIRHYVAACYIAGTLLVSIWTLLRFFTQPTIFDLVGQQVLSQQWLHGTTAGANIGITHYLPKTLLYMPLSIVPGSPRLKLILLTLLVNLIAFLLLFYVLRRLLRELGARREVFLGLAMVWLAALAGSVFWIQFTNSRNLEVVAGMFLVYVGLRLLRQPSWKLAGYLAVFAGAVFFADSLQLYMTAAPLLIYATAMSLYQKRSLQPLGMLVIALIAGVVLSKLLLLAASHWLSLTFLQPAGSSHQTFSALGQGIVGALKAWVHVFSGGADAGKFREVCNILFFGAAATSFVWAAYTQKLPRRFTSFVFVFCSIDTVVYVLSGQAAQPATERYLIMVTPVIVMALAAVLSVLPRRQLRVGQAVLVALVFINLGSLSLSLLHHWNTQFPQDAHLASVARYMAEHKDMAAYASMDTAIPLTYLWGPHAHRTLLPLGCTSTGLVKNKTFFDKEAYTRGEAQRPAQTALILDGMQITNIPNDCSLQTITAQLGQPTATNTTDDGSTVLLYPRSALSELHY